MNSDKIKNDSHGNKVCKIYIGRFSPKPRSFRLKKIIWSISLAINKLIESNTVGN